MTIKNSTNTIDIRKATADHLDELAVLFNAYRVFYGKPSDETGAKAFLHERLTNHDSTIFVSFSGWIMTGFTQLYPLFSSTRMKKLWLLNDLYVHEDFRGRGLSKALIEQAKILCRESGACGFMLETAKTNLVANQLYQSAGLELDGEHNVYNWEVK